MKSQLKGKNVKGHNYQNTFPVAKQIDYLREIFLIFTLSNLNPQL